MKDLIFPIVVFIFLLINSSLGLFCGFLGLHPSIPLILYLLYAYASQKISFKQKYGWIALLIFIFGLGIYVNAIINDVHSAEIDALRMYVALFPAAMYMEQMNEREKKSIKDIVWIVLLTEILLSYYERYTITNVFESEEFNVFTGNHGNMVFRANGLYYHPLSNSYIISVITIFIVCCKDYTLKTKFLVYVMSVISLLCYNSRGNVVLTGVICLPIFLNEIKNFGTGKRVLIIVIASLFLYYGINYALSSELGGRFVFFKEQGGDDWGSTAARIEAFSAFDYLDTQELLWGGYDLYDKLLVMMDLAGIENSYITFILRHGLVLGLPLLVLLLSFVLLKVNQKYDKLSKWLIIGTFLGLGMTNPHLASCFPWMFFIFSYYAFRP